MTPSGDGLSVEPANNVSIGEYSPIELFYLSAQLGGKFILGLDDPLLGYLTEEIDAVRMQVRQRLIDRGDVVVDADDLVVMEPSLHHQIETVTFPDVWVLVGASGSAAAADHTFYLKNGDAVQLTRGTDTTRLLVSLSGVEDVLARLVDLLRLTVQPAAAGGDVSLPGEAFDECWRSVTEENDPSKGQACLERHGVAQESALALSRAMATSERSALVSFYRLGREAWEPTWLRVLEDETGLRLVRSTNRHGRSWVDVASRDATALAADLRRALDSAEAGPGAGRAPDAVRPVA